MKRNYPGGPDVITGALYRKRVFFEGGGVEGGQGEGEVEEREERRREIRGSKHKKDWMLLLA